MKGNYLTISMMLASSVLGLHTLSQAQTSQDTQGMRKGALSDQSPQRQQNPQESSRADQHTAQLDEADQETAQQMRIFEGLDSPNGPAKVPGSRGMADGGSTGSGIGTGTPGTSGGMGGGSAGGK